jgi:hypothetical protein
MAVATQFAIVSVKIAVGLLRIIAVSVLKDSLFFTIPPV